MAKVLGNRLKARRCNIKVDPPPNNLSYIFPSVKHTVEIFYRDSAKLEEMPSSDAKSVPPVRHESKL